MFDKGAQMKIREYYKLLFKNAWDSARFSVGWNRTTIFSILLSLLLGSLLFFVFKGIEKTWDEIVSFLAFTCAPFAFLVLGYFIFHLFQTPAHMYYDLKSYADKFTWNDVEISIHAFPDDYLFSYGLAIKNNKPFELEKVSIKIIYLEADKVSRPIHLYPARLAWIFSRNYLWDDIDIAPNGGEQIASMFNTYIWDGKLVFFVPGPDGQPNERKAMGDLSDDEQILITDYEINGLVDEYALPPKKITIKAQVVDNKLKVEEYKTQS